VAPLIPQPLEGGSGARRIRWRVTQFIHREPVWMLYVRRLTERRCSCYETQSAGRGVWHPNCLGLGYELSLEKFPGRRMARPTEERDIAVFGQMSQTHPIIFMPYYMEPKENDLVVEVLRWQGARPVSVFRVYTVMIALPMSQSEVSFFACGCNPYDLDKTRLLEAIEEMPVRLRTAER
jgi:hypothetical protein